jgi:hypothetical protein
MYIDKEILFSAKNKINYQALKSCGGHLNELKEANVKRVYTV